MLSTRRLITAFRRFWGGILAMVVLGGAASLGVVALTTGYSATSQDLVRVQDLASTVIGANGAGNFDTTRGLTDALAVAQSDAFLATAGQRVGRSTKWLKTHLAISLKPGSDIVTFVSKGDTSGQVLVLANAAADQFATYYSAFDFRRPDVVSAATDPVLGPLLNRAELLQQLQPPVQVVDHAVTATRNGPGTPRAAALGSAGGLVLGLLAVAALELLDDKVRSEDEVAGALRTPIVRFRGRAPDELVSMLADIKCTGSTVVACVSAGERDGRAELCSALVATLDDLGESVALLSDTGEVDDPAGQGKRLQATGRAWAREADALRREADWVVMDVPGVSASARFEQLDGSVDAVIGVTRIGSTSLGDLTLLREALERTAGRGPVLSVIVDGR